MNQKSHYVWPDIVRSLAIFLVVYIHTRPNFETHVPLSWLFSILNLSSYICISLFFLLSGALLLPKKEKTQSFLSKRIMSIIVPWIFWTAVWFVFDYSNKVTQFQNTALTIRIMYKYVFSRFWFMPIIVCMYLLTPLLRFYLKKLATIGLTFLLIIWLFLFILLPILLMYHIVYNPSDTILTILQFLGVYLFGYLIINRYKPIRHIFLWVTIFFVSLITLFIQLQIWPSITATRLNAFPYTYLSPEIIIASSTCFITIYVLFNGKNKITLNKKMTTLFAYISNAALGVYLTHEFFIQLFIKLRIPTFIPLLETVVVFIIACIFVTILKKVPYVRIIVP